MHILIAPHPPFTEWSRLILGVVPFSVAACFDPSEAYRQSEPSLLPTERPRCPKCQGRMMLARIEPGPAHSDLRTFECPKCEHVEKSLVEESDEFR
jgi:hypothetical protein